MIGDGFLACPILDALRRESSWLRRPPHTIRDAVRHELSWTRRRFGTFSEGDQHGWGAGK